MKFKDQRTKTTSWEKTGPKKILTGCSGSVDVEKFVVEVVQLLNGLGQRIGDRVDNLGIEVGHAADRAGLCARDEQLNARIDLGGKVLNVLAELGPVDQGNGRSGPDGMKQGLTGQIVVDEGRN